MAGDAADHRCHRLPDGRRGYGYLRIVAAAGMGTVLQRRLDDRRGTAARAAYDSEGRVSVRDKIKSVLAWIGMVALGIIAIVVVYLRRAASASGLAADSRDRADRVRDDIERAGDDAREAGRDADDAAADNREARDYNREAREIIRRIRERSESGDDETTD